MAKNVKVAIEIAVKNAASAALKEIRGGVTSIKDAVFSLKGALASLSFGITFSVAAKFLVDVNREYGKLLTQLQTFEGSSQGARDTFDKLSKFAATTPFQIGETVDAYVKLRSAGLQPTMESLRLFGDQAAAFGGKINDFALAIRSATTGEFEPLKQFGVQMHVNGDKAIATFKGVRTEIGRDAQSIARYLEDISKANFAGGMERQAKTLDGALSNLVDALETLARAIGDAGLTGDLVKVTRAMTSFLDVGGGEKLYLYFVSIRTVIMTIYDALQLVIHLAFTPIQVFASAAAGLIQSLTGLIMGALMVPAAMVDSVTGNRFNLAEKMKAAAGNRFAAAGNSFANIGRGIQGLGENIGETMARGSLRGEEVDAAAAAAMLAEDNPRSRNKGTSKMPDKGRTTGPSTSMFTGKGKTPDEQRLANFKDLVDVQKKGVEVNDKAIERMERLVDLEAQLRAFAAGKVTDEQRVQALELAGDIKEFRGERGFKTLGEMGLARTRGYSLMGGLTSADVKTSAPDLITQRGGNQWARQLGDAMKGAFQEGERLDNLIARMAGDTLQGFGSAIETAFAAMVDGSKSAGEAFAGAMLGAIAQVARSLGQFLLGKAAMAIGDGLLGDPRGWAAAGKYTAGAVAMFALAGAIGGASNRIGSAGGGGALAGSTSKSLGDTSKGEATIIIEGGLLDMSDPRQEQALAAAIESLTGRRVTVRK
jgi:hypothetical protein